MSSWIHTVCQALYSIPDFYSNCARSVLLFPFYTYRILLRFRVEVRWLCNLSKIKWLVCARAGSQTQSWSNIKAYDDLVSLSIQIFVVKKGWGGESGADRSGLTIGYIVSTTQYLEDFEQVSFTSLSLSFLMSKMGLIVPISRVCEDWVR